MGTLYDRKFTCIPDKRDDRDILHTYDLPFWKPLAKSVDLAKLFWSHEDQMSHGSCVTFGSIDNLRFAKFAEKDNDPPNVDLSHFYLYYYGRKLEGSLPEDAGLQIRDAFKLLAKQGCCTDASYPYVDANFNAVPPATLDMEAAKYKVLSYKRINMTLRAIKVGLMEGFPVCLGFKVFESMMSADVKKTGIIPMPGFLDSLLGGHCINVIGFNDGDSLSAIPNGYFRIRNSWGGSWGAGGDGFLPFGYVLEGLCQDGWTSRTTT